MPVQIIHIVDRKGRTETKVEGAKGSSCLELTKDLEAKLGPVLSSQKTADFYETEDTAIKTERGGGA